MSTTIDSLQIEIQTSSTNAAAGVRDLAKSLGELKSNSKIDTATKNLKALSDALGSFKDASNASRSIGKLTGAMERLKNVGSVTAIANGIKKLSDNLGNIGNVNIGDVAPKIERIAGALAPLSAVKSGGINTMMNGLKNLGEVTKSLDDDTIAAFAEKVEKLNSVLTPLSDKMTPIQGGFKGINTAVKQVSVSVEQANVQAETSVFHLSNVISVIQGVVQALRTVVQKITQVMDAAIEWDGIAARFGRGFGASAQDTYDWIQRLNEEMGINIQQFMQYSSVYATMLTGFGVAMEDAGKMALGYTELTYDIWAGYNDIYAGFADAAEAVKSAIAGEVEPIRRAGFTIVESTLEQTAANHGLNISIEKATEAQKSYLRYLTLVDQAQAQGLIGTYAKELNTAEGLMRTFSQQLKSLAQAFGSLFLPVLVKIMPYVQAFVELLTDAIQALAALFGITIQGVDWSGYQEGVGGVTDGTNDLAGAAGNATEAIKELKNASLGIDELNVISPPSGNGSSGGSGSGNGFENLDVESLWDESIFADIGNQVDKIKEKIKEWMPVIEAVGAVLGALGIGLLLAQLGEGMEKIGQMEGLLGGLKKTLASLAILTIEAVLVFMLADEYLESGNLMALVGEALATATGGYLMYKGFGTKGLAMSLVVSIAAQLAAITLNLADGGVEMDDPELWIQSAFTVATGAIGGGLVFWKEFGRLDAGKGAIFGALAALSLTLAAITIGDITANGLSLTNVITGVLSALAGGAAGAALVTFLGIATGGTGFLIGASVMLAVNVIGAFVGSVSKDSEKSLEKDLSDRFGNVELSVSEVKVLIEKLTPEWANGTEQAVKLREGVDRLVKSIETQEGLLGAYEWQVSVGIGLTQDEMSTYSGAIDKFIADCQGYVSERGYALEIGLKATTSNASIIESANSVSAMASDELTYLGKKLQNTLNKAYEDGLLDIDELEAIQNIRNDMLKITNALKSSDISAELSKLEMKWSGVELSPESFTNMMGEWNNTIENVVKPALESTVTENLKTLHGNVAYLELALEEAETPEQKAEIQKKLDEAKAAVQAYIDENPLENLTIEANFEAVTLGLNTLKDAFEDEIRIAEQEGWFNLDKKINIVLNDISLTLEKTDMGKGEIYTGIDTMMREIAGYYDVEAEGLSKKARKSLEKMLKSLKPTMADFEDIAAESRKAGKAVPENVRDGLNDYNEIAALTGNAKAINYTIGRQFSTDPVFLNTLATAENAGSNIPKDVAEGLLNNIDVVENAADKTVTILSDGIEVGTYNATPVLQQNMKYLGIDLSDGLIAGAETEMEASKKRWTDWAIWPWNWFKETNEINSPSKLFTRGGSYLVQGLLNGIGNNPLGEKLSDVWGKAKSWWDNSKETLKSYTPSIGSIKDKVSAAWSSAKTWWDKNRGTLATYTPSIGKIWEKLKSAWTSAKDWWNKSRSNLSYTPSIGSIYDKLSTRWKNARDWWNKKKGSMSYTPSIGSIKDKLSSAWSSAKKWWSNNVKLSIPSLKLKLTYTTDGLGKVTKAAMKALGLPGLPKLSFAANGGIFDQGSLVWAGERGAEIVANAGGGRTGVMNVQQMQDAVYEGVYAAVVAAMSATSGNNSSQPVNVYLDGKQITATVERRQRERGAAIMGNQVYSY